MKREGETVLLLLLGIEDGWLDGLLRWLEDGPPPPFEILVKRSRAKEEREEKEATMQAPLLLLLSLEQSV